MNKQQLAAKIWESANQMRSKIEAHEYKDYILGFIFYKYLSEQQLRFVRSQGMSDAEIAQLNEADTSTVSYIQQQLGYFIAYDHLFSTWLEQGRHFDVANVRDALSAFNRLIKHKKLFGDIFDTLQTGLSKLGDTAARQTRAIRDLLQLIKDIPMHGRQDYDVLGYIYEYLISQFAANAGKKAGEFYTPHEVSVLMSEIIAHHLKDEQTIEIYDPTSGSGSLLINIGRSLAKHSQNTDNIKYYAQELKRNTYNLTRMNLVMRGIKPDNIFTRNADTLEEDWPYFDDSDPTGTYNPLYVNAVVSNPPYSQKWNPEHKESDPRYARFGLAPKTKADYAFLLHDLYHLKPNGIMTIVLPHGVLSRNEEEQIRKQLIEYNHIETVIGLPANIFFGTGIPTIIMVLRQKRDNGDILMVDASKHFLKVGKNNKLQASDIKRIVDTVTKREARPQFSALVSKATLRDNDYKLNISLYVDSNEATETWDLHAILHGGIPCHEIDQLAHYWQAFPELRASLFTAESSHSARLAVADTAIADTIAQHSQVQAFNSQCQRVFANFHDDLKTALLTQPDALDIAQTEETLSAHLFAQLAQTHCNQVALIDQYHAYQLFHDQWQAIIEGDLEILHKEGMAAAKAVDAYMVNKKVRGVDTQVQDGWQGRILPFALVQQQLLGKELAALQAQENRLAEITAELAKIIESFDEEEKSSPILNDKNDKFAKGELNKALKELYEDVQSEEINTLKSYLKLLDQKAKKDEKVAFVEQHTQVNWQNITTNKDGTYGKSNTNKYLQQLQAEYVFTADSYEAKIVAARRLLDEEGQLEANIKQERQALNLQTKETIESLNDAAVNDLLAQKWISPIINQLTAQAEQIIEDISQKVRALSEKYATTLGDLQADIQESEKALAQMLGELTGSDADRQAIAELQQLLQGD